MNAFIKNIFWLCLCSWAIPLLTQAQVTWFAERITSDTTQIGQNPSYFIDSNGFIHLAFWESTTDRLMYAKKHVSASEWSFQKVNSAKTGGYVSKIKLSPDGLPAIAYFENVNEQLQVRLASQQPNGSWLVQEVLPLNWGMYGTNALNAPGYLHASIDFDYFNNKPYIIFFDARYIIDPFEYYGLEMYVTYPNTPTNWIYQSYGNIPMFDINITYREWKAGAKYGEFCTIVKQQNGNWTIFTAGTGNGELYRFTTVGNPTFTNRTSIDSAFRVNPQLLTASQTIKTEHKLFATFEGISATEATNQDLHVTYAYSNLYGRNNFANYFSPAHLTLQHLRITPNGDIFYNPVFTRDSVYRNYTSVKTHNNDTVFISFCEPTNNLIRLAYSLDTGATWTYKNLITMSNPNAYAPLYIYQDSLYCIYFHTDNQRLEMATLPLNNLNATWNIQPISKTQKTTNIVATIANKVGNDYQVYVAYSDAVNQKLLYAHKANGTWNYYSIENNRDVTSADLQLDKNGNLCIAYFDQASNQLRYAKQSGTSFTYEVIAPTAYAQFVNLRFSPTKDTAHVAYYDYNLDALVYARKILNGSWQFDFPLTIGSTIAGEFTSLAIDGYGLPHIAFYDRTNKSLKYAFKTLINPNWQNETIFYKDSVDAGSFCKIVIGPNNIPQVAWLNKTANQIEYAKKVLNAWMPDTVVNQTVGLVGMPLQMITDDSSSAWIVYNVQNALPEIRIARKSYNQDTWGSLFIANNNFQLANIFQPQLLDTVLFIAGKTNKPNELGLGLLTGIISFTAVSNDEPYAQTTLTLYPNPCSNHLFLRIENFTQPIPLTIYDLHGRKIMEHTLTEPQHTFDLTELPPAIYLLQIGNAHQKIIKQ